MRDDVQKSRQQWKEQQIDLDVNKLVFIDESSLNCGMTRLYGRAYTNERVYEYVPDIRFERTSIISSIRLSGETVPMIFKGSLNGDVFRSYVSENLAPTLCKDDIVILDNLSSHKVSNALDPIFKKGAHVIFLPPYSPDLNPIELSWSKMKSTVRKLKPRTYEELIFALQIALDSFTIKDISNWFNHHGYITNV